MCRAVWLVHVACSLALLCKVYTYNVQVLPQDLHATGEAGVDLRPNKIAILVTKDSKVDDCTLFGVHKSGMLLLSLLSDHNNVCKSETWYKW